MFLPPQEDVYNIRIIKFYCGATCLYFPLISISILCTDLLYQTGKYSFIPVLCLMAVFEVCKCIFVSSYYKETDKSLVRHANKSTGSATRRWHSERVIKDIFKGLFLFSVMTFVYFVVAILFGAELLRNTEETLMFSCMLSVLTVLPPCVHLGPNSALAAILGEDMTSVQSNPLSAVLQHVLRTTILGAWLGAFVIPLDWSRPWQTWPVPCCVGALMGYVAAHASAMVEVALPKYVRNKISSKLK